MNVYQIEPLKDVDNYMVWKIKVWEYIDRKMMPSDVNQKPAWEKKDRAALSMI